MKKYEVILSNTEDIKRIVEAKNEKDAKKKASTNNPNDILSEIKLSNSFWTVEEINQICSYCETVLEPIFLDEGTIDHLACPKCKRVFSK